MKRFALVIPFLFTLASLLQLFYVAAIVVSPNQNLRPLIVLWAVLLILVQPINWLLRDWNWTAIFLTALVLSFYFSSGFFSIILILIVFALLFLIILKWIKGEIPTSQYFLNLLAGIGIFFVLYSVYLNGVMLKKIPLNTYIDSVSNVRKHSLDGLTSLESRPDIYYQYFTKAQNKVDVE